MTGAAMTGAGLEFGDELRRYRTVAGLSLRSLAEKVGFDFSYLGQVERGERGGSLLLVRRCDTALGASGHLLRVFADKKSRPPRPPEPRYQACMAELYPRLAVTVDRIIPGDLRAMPCERLWTLTP